MSRKMIFSLAAVATLAGAAFMSSNADAMMHNGGRSNFRTISHVDRIDRRIGHRRIHERRHFVRSHKHIWIRPVGYVEGITTVQPRPVHLPDQRLHAGRPGGVPGICAPRKWRARRSTVSIRPKPNRVQ